MPEAQECVPTGPGSSPPPQQSQEPPASDEEWIILRSRQVFPSSPGRPFSCQSHGNLGLIPEGAAQPSVDSPVTQERMGVPQLGQKTPLVNPNFYCSGLLPFSCPWDSQLILQLLRGRSGFFKMAQRVRHFSNHHFTCSFPSQKGPAGVSSGAGTILELSRNCLEQGILEIHLLLEALSSSDLLLCFVPGKVFRAAGSEGSCEWSEHGAGMQEGWWL